MAYNGLGNNKSAKTRHFVLDGCLRNRSIQYTKTTLLEKVNDVLIEEGYGGIQIRTLEYDIKFMKSANGYNAPIESFWDVARNKDGKLVNQKIFRYSDPNFSIRDIPWNETDVKAIKELALLLEPFKGLPEFDSIKNLISRVDPKYQLNSDKKPIIEYTKAPFAKSEKYINELLEKILNKVVIQIKYKPFKKEIKNWIIHPYYLKQYNYRWFLFGWNDEEKKITNIALDRIEGHIISTNKKYKKTKINFSEYFEDVVGVSVNESKKSQTVRLAFSIDQWDYIKTKPIHESQKEMKKLSTENEIIVDYDVQLNFEFTSELLKFRDSVRVIKPKKLKEELIEIHKKCLKNYNAS
tara:strand:- start:9196 stop:10251 length:1056 start_codon:yes stop_codon:yes gene_type:complete